jgi:hypothetical protein
MKRKFLSVLFLVVFLSLFLVPAVSAGIVPCGTIENDVPCTLCHLIVGFWNLISYGLKILVFVALAGLTIAGIMYIFSAGSETLITAAKNFIKNILYGVGIVLAAWLLIFAVMNYLGTKPDLGIQKESWNKFTCGMESNIGAPTPSGTTVTANNCCVVGPGQCGHVVDASKCTNGKYYEKPCSEISECTSTKFSGNCGNEELGLCYDGWWGSKCPNGYDWMSTGEDCPSGLYCCVKKSRQGELCGGKVGEKGTCQPKPCPDSKDPILPLTGLNYPLCESNLVCCP